MNEVACPIFRIPGIGSELENQVNLLHAARLALSGQLLGAIVHEMQQPLIAVRLRARNGRDLLAGGRHSIEAMEEIFVDIEGCVASATEIADRLRLLSDKRPLALEPLDLNEAVREVARIAELQAKSRGATLELRLTPGLPMIDADRVSIQHAALDLIINGMEALDPLGDGLVTVETGGGRDHVELRISDTGSGIESGSRHRLFEPFFTTKPDGTGLGLAIARSIVEAHRGRLDIEDRLASGACFRIQLPLAVGVN
jgi:signal transduction histidine kinase